MPQQCCTCGCQRRCADAALVFESTSGPAHPSEAPGRGGFSLSESVGAREGRRPSLGSSVSSSPGGLPPALGHPHSFLAARETHTFRGSGEPLGWRVPGAWLCRRTLGQLRTGGRGSGTPANGPDRRGGQGGGAGCRGASVRPHRLPQNVKSRRTGAPGHGSAPRDCSVARVP